MKKILLVILMLMFGFRFQVSSADPNDVVGPEPIEPYQSEYTTIDN